MDFGNCWNNDGTVRAYLAGKLIGEAGPNTPNLIIEFAIPEDSLLEIKDEGLSSVIKFTNFEMVDCSGKCKLLLVRSLKNDVLLPSSFPSSKWNNGLKFYISLGRCPLHRHQH